MPTLDGTTVYLISQYDARVLPEYAPAKPDPFLDQETIRLYDADTRTVSVYTPVYRNSQFWIAYHSLSLENEPHVKWHYYKLSINGRHIVSWGCGKDDGWAGKTMFGLYKGYRTEDEQIVPCTEVRSFYWGRAEDEDARQLRDDVIEIKMYRARARKWADPDLRMCSESVAAPLSMHKNTEDKLEQNKVATVGLFNAGYLMYGQPQRFFKYALVDPVDQPYVTFRYLYRTLPMLKELGVVALDELEKQEAESAAASPYTGELQKRTGPRMVPSVSLHSIVSVRSDTGLQVDPDDSAPGMPSPSPLRIPAISSMSSRFVFENVSRDDLSTQTRDSLDSEDDQGKQPSKYTQLPSSSLYLNQNSPIHSKLAISKKPGRLFQQQVRDLRAYGDETEQPRPRTAPELSKIPLLRPQASKEQMFRNCISNLLEQPPAPLRPTTPVPDDGSPTPAPRRNRLFTRSSSEILRDSRTDSAEPQRSTSSMSTRSTSSLHSHMGSAWINDIFTKAKHRAEERAKKEQSEGRPVQVQNVTPTKLPQRIKAVNPNRQKHAQSMTALQGVVHSARDRRSKEKEDIA